MRRSFWRLLPALLLTLFAAACGDLPTEKPAGETAQLGFSLNLSGTTVNTVSVEVTAADISQALVFNIPVTNGTATGRIDVPPGQARTITVRAYDVQGVQTHEGSTTVDVRPGNNPTVTVTLIPRAGDVPIEVNFGSVFIELRPLTWPDMHYGYSIGRTAQFEAVVRSSDGSVVPGAVVRWASLDPGVMSVTQDGYGYAHALGTTEIVATWNGYGTSLRVSVAGQPDYATPELKSIAFDQSVVRFTGSHVTVNLDMTVTDDVSGVAEVNAEIRDHRGYSQWCSARPTTTPNLWRCTLTVDGGFYTYGDFDVTYVTTQDNAGNGFGMSLPYAGLEAGFTVTP